MVKRGWKRENVPRSDEEDEDADYAFKYTIEQIMNILKTIHLLETSYIVNISSALFTSAILKTLHSERFYCLQIHKNIIVISGGIDTGTFQSARDNNVYCLRKPQVQVAKSLSVIFNNDLKYISRFR